MEYRKLGKTGIKVSEIALGCEGFVGKTKEETEELLKYSYENGINFMDLYSPNPELRSNLGYAINKLGIRDNFAFEAHLCTALKNGQYERTRDIKRVKEAFSDLLKRLNTAYIDVGMIHYVDGEKDLDEILNGKIIAYAKELKALGKIKSIGLSSHNPIVARRAVETGLIDVLLFSINPAYDMQPASENCNELWDSDNYKNIEFQPDKDREQLYELCEKQSVAITVMKCYGGGDLLNSGLSPFKRALTTSQCISYCLTRPAVASVMLGIRTKEELFQALQYESAGKQERDYSEVLSKLPRGNMSGKCVYCGHCAPCAVGIDIAGVNKFAALVKAEKIVPETVREHYRALEHHASECIKCGKCEKNCPFGVGIIKKLEEATDIFGY